MTARIIGGHPPDAGGLAMAVRRGAAAGMEAIQIFTAPPVYYNEKVGAKPERIAALREALVAAAIEPRNVLVHAAYVLNTASEDPAKAERARRGLAQELKRSTAYGVGGCCFHPGSAGQGDPGSAFDQVGDAIAYALEQVPGTDSRTRVLIENTAGAGRTVGRSPGEVARMLSRVPASLRARTGYGLDTCHLYASGYDIRSSPAAMRAVLDEFEQVLGERAAFFHLNDSRYPLGSNKDRHAWIGEGVLGVEPFRWLLADDRTAGVPLILETPQEGSEVRGDDPSPDPADVRMVQLLRSLL
ncbi:MAG: deoxyribonuclease IV [Gemmatimonadaceae bacterium]|nr:deoxyribonuclease IV [Gemmatimonadaceae bacterium]